MVNEQHAGGGFNLPEPTTKGGVDFGRFVRGVRSLQDHARTIDAPDEVITEAADLLDKLSALLTPYDGDEWSTPTGRRFDLPNRGGILGVPSDLAVVEGPDGQRSVAGTVHFNRFYLGRNGAAHGGALGLLFDSLLGFTAASLTGRMTQRTAFLHIDYRKIVPVEKTLRVQAELQGQEGRKIFVAAKLFDPSDGDALLAEAHALFVKLKPGQP